MINYKNLYYVVNLGARPEYLRDDTMVSAWLDLGDELDNYDNEQLENEMWDLLDRHQGRFDRIMELYKDLRGTEALRWSYEGFEGKHVIMHYITNGGDDVRVAFDGLDEAVEYMDNADLWDDYYIYFIDNDGRAYAPNF